MNKHILAGLFGATLCASSPSQAALLIAIFTGRAWGTDVTGLFGPPGAIVDAPSSIAYYFDDTVGLANPIFRVTLSVGTGFFSFRPSDSFYVFEPWDVHEGPWFVGNYYLDDQGLRLESIETSARAAGIDDQNVSYSNFEFNIQGSYTGEAYGSGSGGSGGYRLVTFVPEPASWAMMVTGFGVLGSALRRRHLIRLRTAAPA